MTHGSLFSGIGGFDLAAEWMGWTNVFHCEWNDFGQRVLKYYWPDAESFIDITKTDFTKYADKIDILTGGFPCQPYSQAGKRLGKEDERHLWPEMLRAIQEIRPRYVVGENVAGIINWNGGLVFEEVQTDLEAQGYEVQPVVLPAAGVGAPHRRDRVWFVAYSNGAKQTKPGGSDDQEKREVRRDEKSDVPRELFSLRNATDADGRRQPSKEHRETEPRRTAKKSVSDYWQNFPTQSPICGRNDGISFELDRITFSKWRNESIKAYGNAIVPQVAYQIFRAIIETENKLKAI